MHDKNSDGSGSRSTTTIYLPSPMQPVIMQAALYLGYQLTGRDSVTKSYIFTKPLWN